MAVLDTTQTVPLAPDEEGTIRFTGSRVTLDSVLHEFLCGSTAEQIRDAFPSLELWQIYAAIAYFLRHREEVEEYLHKQQEASEQIRLAIERLPQTQKFRDRVRKLGAKS